MSALIPVIRASDVTSSDIQVYIVTLKTAFGGCLVVDYRTTGRWPIIKFVPAYFTRFEI